MTQKIEIPADLQRIYYDATHYPNDHQGSAPYSNGKLKQLIERIAAAEARVAELSDMVAALSAPVSDAEWKLFACDASVENDKGFTELEHIMWRGDVDALLRARPTGGHA